MIFESRLKGRSVSRSIIMEDEKGMIVPVQEARQMQRPARMVGLSDLESALLSKEAELGNWAPLLRRREQG